MDPDMVQRFEALDSKITVLSRRFSRLLKRLLRRIDELERWKIEHEATVGPLIKLLQDTVAYVDELRQSRSRMSGAVWAALTIGGVIGTVLGLVLGR